MFAAGVAENNFGTVLISLWLNYEEIYFKIFFMCPIDCGAYHS
jgi:hypothetical protein